METNKKNKIGSNLELTRETTVTSASTYTINDLQKHSLELFGVSTATFVGATYGLDTEKQYTVSEMNDIINKWCGKAVK